MSISVHFKRSSRLYRRFVVSNVINGMVDITSYLGLNDNFITCSTHLQAVFLLHFIGLCGRRSRLKQTTPNSSIKGKIGMRVQKCVDKYCLSSIDLLLYIWLKHSAAWFYRSNSALNMPVVWCELINSSRSICCIFQETQLFSIPIKFYVVCLFIALPVEYWLKKYNFTIIRFGVSSVASSTHQLVEGRNNSYDNVVQQTIYLCVDFET